MLIPRLVEIAIKILDIIERADIEWVPSQSIIEYIGDEREPTVQTILARLVMADILSAKRGPCGGYKQEYSTSLQMLMRICAPSCLDIVPSKSEDVNKVQRRILQLFADTTFTPKTPTIYKTASTDAHEPTEGLPNERIENAGT